MLNSDLENYGYDVEDIVVLIDDGGPRHLQPTKANIVRSACPHIDEVIANSHVGIPCPFIS